MFLISFISTPFCLFPHFPNHFIVSVIRHYSPIGQFVAHFLFFFCWLFCCLFNFLQKFLFIFCFCHHWYEIFPLNLLVSMYSYLIIIEIISFWTADKSFSHILMIILLFLSTIHDLLLLFLGAFFFFQGSFKRDSNILIN